MQKGITPIATPPPPPYYTCNGRYTDCHIKYDDMKIDKLVRLNSWVSTGQKRFLKKEAKITKKSEAELVREALYKVYNVK